MTEKIKRDDLVLLLALVDVQGDDGEGNEEINKDGFEDGVLNTLQHDVSINGGVEQTRILKIAELGEHNIDDAMRDKFLDAAETAQRIMQGTALQGVVVWPTQQEIEEGAEAWELLPETSDMDPRFFGKKIRVTLEVIE